MITVTLLLIFQAKHFLADYILQGEMMLGKFSRDSQVWVPALVAHCSVHVVMTICISLWYTHNIKQSLALGLFDFVIHFGMDRLKASPDLMGRFKPVTAEEYKACVNMSDGWTPSGQYIDDVGVRSSMRKIGKKKLLGNKLFWWCLGIDQTVHHITHYIIITCIVGM